jgi:hypothetical protein
MLDRPTPITEFIRAINDAQHKLFQATSRKAESIVIELDTIVFEQACREFMQYSCQPDRHRGVEELVSYPACGCNVILRRKPHKCNCEYCNKK